MADIKLEEILRYQPFRNIVRAVKVESLGEIAGLSGQTFKVTGSDGKRYKLHYADGWFAAREIEKTVEKLPHLFPKCYGREGRFLLFDWIEGRMLTKEEKNPEVYRRLGEWCADVHNLNEVKKGNIDKYFFERLGKIPASIVSNEEKARITWIFEGLRKEIDVEIVVELHDIIPENFMVDKKGRMYLVDEGAFMHRIKGLGIAKALMKWIIDPKKRAAFWEGYTQKHSNDYFDNEYERFVMLIECVRAIAFKTGRADLSQPEFYKTELIKLKELCGI
ncbi:hypothetical protein HY485_01460 [Candidatus Woesearchaeota archaeon]|nr:hypothetical protein [Candidatus Woesearchaeota archaeon]